MSRLVGATRRTLVLVTVLLASILAQGCGTSGRELSPPARPGLLSDDGELEVPAITQPPAMVGELVG